MKIQRLYESDEKIELDKKLDIFDYFRERYAVDQTTKKLLVLINEYIVLNAKHLHLRYNISSKVLPIIDISLDEPFDLTLISYNKSTYELEPDDFDELLDFIEDSETYKNNKKFNL